MVVEGGGVIDNHYASLTPTLTGRTSKVVVLFFLFLFSEYSKIISSSGSELTHYSGCQYRYYYGDGLIGELVEAPFNGSSFLTAKVKLSYQGSVVRSEFAILEYGKGLDSGTC